MSASQSHFDTDNVKPESMQNLIDEANKIVLACKNITAKAEGEKKIDNLILLSVQLLELSEEMEKRLNELLINSDEVLKTNDNLAGSYHEFITSYTTAFKLLIDLHSTINNRFDVYSTGLDADTSDSYQSETVAIFSKKNKEREAKLLPQLYSVYTNHSSLKHHTIAIIADETERTRITSSYNTQHKSMVAARHNHEQILNIVLSHKRSDNKIKLVDIPNKQKIVTKINALFAAKDNYKRKVDEKSPIITSIQSMIQHVSWLYRYLSTDDLFNIYKSPTELSVAINKIYQVTLAFCKNSPIICNMKKSKILN